MKRTAPMAALLAFSLLVEPLGPCAWAAAAAQSANQPSASINLGGAPAAGPAGQAKDLPSLVPPQGLASVNMPLAPSINAVLPSVESSQGLAQAQPALMTAPGAIALPVSDDAANAPLSQDQARVAAGPLAAAAGPEVAQTAPRAGSSFNSRLLKFARGLFNVGGRQGAAEEASRALFDGAFMAARRAPKPVEAEPSSPAKAGLTAQLNPSSEEKARLSELHPRVVFLLDVFDKPASARTAQYIQTLVDAGVHVVFLTWRPQKGPGSADEIFLSKITKYGRNNPIIVVSYNGGRIALHSKAADPTALIDDVGAFTKKDIETFRAINARLQSKLDVKLTEKLDPSENSSFSYVLSLAKSVPAYKAARLRAELLRRYNTALKSAGLPYRMAEHPDNPRAIIVHAMPLRMSLKRVIQALQKQFGELNWEKHSNRFLILADSKKSPKFTRAFLSETSKAEIQVVKNGEDMDTVLRNVLGDRTLKTISINLNQLRQFSEFWEPYHTRRPAADSLQSGGRAGTGATSPGDQRLAGHVGTVVHELMPWFLKTVSRGQYSLTFLPALRARVQDMWRNPKKYYMFVRKPVAQLMKTEEWRRKNIGYLNRALAWVDNYYGREFSNYPIAMQNVMHNLVGLSTDGSLMLPFQSPSTGQFFKIYLRIPWVMKSETPHGLALTANTTRTGASNPNDLTGIYPKLLAMGLLMGYCRKGADGLWHHGSPSGPVVTELRVKFEYLDGHRVVTFKPEQFFGLVNDASGRRRSIEDFLIEEEVAHPKSETLDPKKYQEEGLETTRSDEMQDAIASKRRLDRQNPYRMVPASLVNEITGTILRMKADKEFLDYYKKEQEEASASDLNKRSRSSSRKTAPKTAPKKGKAKRKKGK